MAKHARPSPVRPVVTRMLSFSALPLISSVAPMLLLPLISRIESPAGWAAILSSQAIGSFTGMVVMFGWSVAGQARIAQCSSKSDRQQIYLESIHSRVTIGLVALPAGLAVSVWLCPQGFRSLALLMTAAVSLLGFSPSWYSIGTGRARLIAKYEALPKLLATAVSAVLVSLTRLVWPYPVLLLIGGVLGISLFQKSEFGVPVLRDAFRVRRHGTALSDWRAAFASISGTAYASAPMPIATRALDPAAAGRFGSADKVYRYGLYAVTALGNALQGWVLQRSVGHSAWRRQAFAILCHAALATAVLLVFVFLGPTATDAIFGAHVKAARGVCVFYGLAYFAVALSTPLIRNILVPYGRTGVVLVATLVSATVGIVTMIWFAADRDPAGISAGYAVSELLGLCVMLFPGLVTLRSLAPDTAAAVVRRGALLEVPPES